MRVSKLWWVRYRVEDYQLDDALKEVAKLDEKYLTEAACKTMTTAVAKAILERMTDEEEIAVVAKKAQWCGSAESAVAKLTDQKLIEKIAAARRDGRLGIRKDAVRKLTDRSVLEEIAKRDKYSRIREAAAARLAALSAPAEKSDSSGEAERQYFEKDNIGTRHDTMSKATAYWLAERPGASVKPPFTLFNFDSAEAAEAALLELPFIHKASDTGNLICDRLMTFGYYETTENNAPTGKYEAVIVGSDLTYEEYKLAEDSFTRHGGTLKNHDEPDSEKKAAAVSAGDKSLVKYKETVTSSDGFGTSTYEVYTGPDKASAVEFLKDKTVTKNLYYIVVETPEGNFGKDRMGFYQE